MPNTPALVGAGAAAIAGGAAADEDDLAWAEAILGAVGTVVRVPEHLLDAVTGLSGSGPAYVFLVAEALIDAGVLGGLPRDVAAALTEQLLVGSARLLAGAATTPEPAPGQGHSPGGTTAAGLRPSSGPRRPGRVRRRRRRPPPPVRELGARRDSEPVRRVRNRSDSFSPPRTVA